MKWTKLIINGFKTSYIISENGDIINTKTTHYITKYLADGYIRATLKSEKTTSSRNVAKVMLESFYNKTQNDNEILYFIDGDITNLSLNNFKYITIDEYITLSIEKLFNKIDENLYQLIHNEYEDELWSKIIIDKSFSKYMVSNYGRIINSITGEFLHPTIPESDEIYAYITLRQNGKGHRFDIHNLVGVYFIPNPKPNIYNVVHHKNNDKHDFHYKNLEWTDSSGNSKHAVNDGIIAKGEDAKSAKITEETAREICIMLSEGYRVCEIVNKLNVSRNIVRHIKDGNTWTHISSDYDINNYNNGLLTINDINTILDLINKNKTYKEIHDITGFGTNTIYRIKKNYSINRNKMTSKSKNRIDAIILKLYNDDVTIDQIEELTGFNSTYILDTISHFYS